MATVVKAGERSENPEVGAEVRTQGYGCDTFNLDSIAPRGRPVGG